MKSERNFEKMCLRNCRDYIPSQLMFASFHYLHLTTNLVIVIKYISHETYGYSFIPLHLPYSGLLLRKHVLRPRRVLRGAHRRYVARCDQLPVRVRLGLGGRELRAADVHQRSHVFQWRSVHVSYNERVKVTRDKVTRVEVARVKVIRVI